MNVIQRLTRKYKEGVLLNAIYRLLIKKRIKIILYYVFWEGLDLKAFNHKPRLAPCETSFLGPSDMNELATREERDFPEKYMLEMLAEGRKCLGIKYNDEIVAYSWVNLNNCHCQWFPFPLEENEAYLYAARTFKKYRGKNLAPYLRFQLYKRLHEMGRTKLYSLTEFQNVASIRFKQKLGARRLKLCLNIKLFDKHRWNFILRNYRNS